MSGGGVRRIEVTERESPVFGGTEFGAVGPYERLHGTVFGELDPAHPLNIGIVNLDRAARNAHGWRLVDDRHVEITRPTAPGFDRGAIYEFIYRARDPIVMGIGFAAIRDIVSFLRYDTTANPLAPQGRPRIRRALGFGISQSGRVLRDLVYLGFNQDLAGRQVFDGILPVVAGSRRTCVNWQFAQAGRYSRQHEDHS